MKITPDFLEFKYQDSKTPLQGINSSKIVLDFTECRKKFGISDLEKNERIRLADTIYKFSNITWYDSTFSHKHGLGFEEISRSSIKKHIPTHLQEGYKFYAIRFHGKKPLVGYENEGIFVVLWIDRNFTVYPH